MTDENTFFTHEAAASYACLLNTCIDRYSFTEVDRGWRGYTVGVCHTLTSPVLEEITSFDGLRAFIRAHVFSEVFSEISPTVRQAVGALCQHFNPHI